MWAELSPWRPENRQTGMSHCEAGTEEGGVREAYTHWVGYAAALGQDAEVVEEKIGHVPAAYMMRTVTLAGHTGTVVGQSNVVADPAGVEGLRECVSQVGEMR